MAPVNNRPGRVHMDCGVCRVAVRVAVNPKKTREGGGEGRALYKKSRATTKEFTNSVVLKLVAAFAVRASTAAIRARLKTSGSAPTVEPRVKYSVTYTRRHPCVQALQKGRRTANG